MKVDADETDAPVASLADHDDSDEDGIVGGSGGALEAAPAKKAAATKPLASAVKAFLSLPEGSVPVAAPAPVAGDSVAAPASPASSNEDGIVGSLGGAMAAGGVAIMDVEDGIVSAGDAGPVGAGPVAAPVARHWVPAIGGLGMITCQHYTPAGGVGYVNWLLKWTWQGKVWEKTHCVTIIHKPSWPL